MEPKKLYWKIVKHIKFLCDDEDYFGSDHYAWTEKFLYEELIKNNYLDEEFFDERLKYDAVEIWCEVIYALGAIDVQLRKEQELLNPNPN
jgi:hypothetical protein